MYKSEGRSCQNYCGKEGKQAKVTSYITWPLRNAFRGNWLSRQRGKEREEKLFFRETKWILYFL